jgi:hypothetical protein
MNKETYIQIINKVYEKYLDSYCSGVVDSSWSNNAEPWDIENFIRLIKNDERFSDVFGLKIEERELTMLERCELANLTPNMSEIDWCNKLCDEYGVPKKLITLTYQVYE